jgi:hypothetical protein
MTKFVLLYNGGGMPESEAEQAAVLKAWEDWYTELGKVVVDPGNPFSPVAKSVKRDGTVIDGPVGTMASGYSILEAESLDAAVEMAKGCPMLAGNGDISIFEAFEIM